MHPPKRGLCTVCCRSVPPEWHCPGARHRPCRERTRPGAPQPSETALRPSPGTGTPCTHTLWQCPSFTQPVSASDPQPGQTPSLPSTHPPQSWQRACPGQGSRSHQPWSPGAGRGTPGGPGAPPAATSHPVPRCPRDAGAGVLGAGHPEARGALLPRAADRVGGCGGGWVGG